MTWSKIRLTGYSILGSSALLFVVLFFGQKLDVMWPAMLVGGLLAVFAVIDIVASSLTGRPQQCSICGHERIHRPFFLTKACPHCSER